MAGPDFPASSAAAAKADGRRPLAGPGPSTQKNTPGPIADSQVSEYAYLGPEQRVP